MQRFDDGAWEKIRRDMEIRPVEANIKENGEQVRYVIDWNSDEALIRKILTWYGIEDNKVTLWGTGKPLREFLWSEDMADASVHILLNVDFKDIIGIEKYSSVHYGVAADGVVDRNHSTGRGGYIPSLGEIRNRHINVGTGKELTIRELSELVIGGLLMTEEEKLKQLERLQRVPPQEWRIVREALVRRMTLEFCGIDRPMCLYDPEVGDNVYRPLYEVASSKLARKTHVDMLNKVQINYYAAGLHREGSKAAFGEEEYRV